jgi:hypothetical protein
MISLVIKCYLPNGKKQYVLQPSEQLKVTFGEGGDICPDGFVDHVTLEFSVLDGDWVVTTKRGQAHLENGDILASCTPVVTPLLIALGFATIVLDSVVDPRIGHQAVGERRPSAKPGQRSPKPATAATGVAGSLFGKPALSPLGAPAVGKALHPALSVPVKRPVTAGGSANPVGSELSAPVVAEDVQRSAEQAASAAPKQGSSKLKSLAYAVLAAAVAVSGFGMIRASDAAEGRPVTRAPIAANVAPAPSEPTPEPKIEKRAVTVVTTPNARRAAEALALGNMEEALAQYRALASAPNADPVFNVIARALEQRARRSKVKKP